MSRNSKIINEQSRLLHLSWQLLSRSLTASTHEEIYLMQSHCCPSFLFIRKRWRGH